MATKLVIGALVMVTFSASSPFARSFAREWRNTHNAVIAVGDFVEITGEKVILTDENGKSQSVLLNELSDDDRLFASTVGFHCDYARIKKPEAEFYRKTPAAMQQLLDERKAGFVKKYQNKKICIFYEIRSLAQEKKHAESYELSLGDPQFIFCEQCEGSGQSLKINIPRQDVPEIVRGSFFICVGNLVFSDKDQPHNNNWRVKNELEKCSLRNVVISMNTSTKIIKLNAKLKKNGETKLEKNEVLVTQQIQSEIDKSLKIKQANDEKEHLEELLKSLP